MEKVEQTSLSKSGVAYWITLILSIVDLGAGSKGFADPSIPVPANPIVGLEFAIDNPLFSEASSFPISDLSLASNGQFYLAVWQQGPVDGDQNIFGARVTQDGVLVDRTDFPIHFGIGKQWNPRAASNGKDFLVVWLDSRMPDSPQLYGARVTERGVVLDPEGFNISQGRGNPAAGMGVASNGKNYLIEWGVGKGYGALIDADPEGIRLTQLEFGQAIGLPAALASNGTDYLAVWQRAEGPDANGPRDLFGLRISGHGQILDTQPLEICIVPGDQRDAVVASDGTDFFVAWSDYRNKNSSIQTPEIFGTRVTAAGAVLDKQGSLIESNAYVQSISYGIGGYLLLFSNDPITYSTTSQLVFLSAGESPFSKRQLPIKFQDFHTTVASAESSYLVAGWSGKGISFDALTKTGEIIGWPWRPREVLNKAPQDQVMPAMASNGEIVFAVWREFGLRGARLTTNGEILDSGRLLTSDFIGKRPVIATNGHEFAVAWWKMNIIRFDRQGNSIDPEILKFDPWAASSPVIASDGKDFLVVWCTAVPDGPPGRSKYALLMKTVPANGSKPGPTMQLSKWGEFVGSPSIANNGSSYFIVWKQVDDFNFSVHAAQVLVHDGIYDFNDTIIPTGRAALDGTIEAVVGSNGKDYLVAWYGTTGPSFVWGILGMRFDSTGQAIDNVPVLISATQNGPFDLQITSRRGEYLLVWETYPDRYQKVKILGARFSSDGVARDPVPFAISTAPDSSQFPSAVPTEQGYLIAYQRTGLSGEKRIAGRSITFLDGSFWLNQDIGTMPVSGGARFNTNSATVSGAGEGWNLMQDTFQFLFQRSTNSCEVVGRFARTGSPTNGAMAGLMIRAGLADTSPFAVVGLDSLGQASFSRRTVTNSASVATPIIPALGPWLKILWITNTAVAFQSRDGTNWSFLGFAPLPASGEIQAGLAVASGNALTLASISFEDLFVQPLSPLSIEDGRSVPRLLYFSELNKQLGQVDSLAMLAMAPPGGSLCFEVSENLVAWRTAATLPNLYGVVPFQEPESSGDRRFYRVRRLP